MTPQNHNRKNRRAGVSAPQLAQDAQEGGVSDLLGQIDSELTPLFTKLHELRDRCEAEDERRIAHEINQGIRALDEARHLIGVYRSGEKLPTLAEMKGIYKNL